MDLAILKWIWSQIRSSPPPSDFALFAFGSVHFTFQKYNINFLLFLHLDLCKSDGRRLDRIWSQIRSSPPSFDFALFAFGSVHFTFQKYSIYFLLFLHLDLYKKYKSDGRGLDRI